MSCHISALCIALPSPKRGLAETTFWGEEFPEGGERHPSRPLQSTNNTSATPFTLWWQLRGRGGEGGGLRGEHLPPHSPSFSRRRRSSALIPPQVYAGQKHNMLKGESCNRPDLFFRSAWLRRRGVLHGGSDHRTCRISCPLYSRSHESQWPLISERLHTQVIALSS